MCVSHFFLNLVFFFVIVNFKKMFVEECFMWQYHFKGKPVIVSLNDSKRVYKGVFASLEWFQNYMTMPNPPPKNAPTGSFGVYDLDVGNYVVFAMPSSIHSIIESI